MDLAFSSEAEAFRAHVRAFLAAHVPAGWPGMGALDGDEAHQFSVRWRKVLADNGFIGITWPVAYGGGGRSKLDQIILARNSPAPASRSAG